MLGYLVSEPVGFGLVGAVLLAVVLLARSARNKRKGAAKETGRYTTLNLQ